MNWRTMRAFGCRFAVEQQSVVGKELPVVALTGLG
jgi:hypothetical protein